MMTQHSLLAAGRSWMGHALTYPEWAGAYAWNETMAALCLMALEANP